MTTMLLDEDARRRAMTEMETTFLVEAGAGVGKTSVLVQRVLALVRSGRAQLDQLAVITFTEKAATELRARLHFAIEETLTETLTESERQALRAARRQFDRAQISTVHAFCANLLRERPVEARVDPDFSVLDAFEAGVLRREVWRDWLVGEMEGNSDALKRALRAELTLTHIEALRDFLLEHRESMAFLPGPMEDRLTKFTQTCGRIVTRLKECVRACRDATDRAHMQMTALFEACSAVETSGAWERLFIDDLSLSAKAGAKTNWQPTKTLDEVRKLFGELLEARAQAREAWAHNLTVRLVTWLQGYLRAYDEKKRERSCLDFADLLLLTRDLLSRDLAVRRYLQNRFRFLLVDEFQDTDPLQAELIFFLAEREPRAHEWTDVTLQPGKLFLVGDPQQSIYRFRRADLQIYGRVREIISRQGELLSLSTNFRTRAPAVAWINDTFTREFAAMGAAQPAYRPLQESRQERTGREVILFPVPLTAERAGREERRQAEARAVALFLTRMVGELGVEFWGGRTMAYRDVAILCRTHQTLEAYEDAFREVGTPHRVVGGRRYAQRQEIEDLRALLRALESPSDTAAVIATLRSSLFGFSDEELAAFACEGGRFAYAHHAETLSQTLASPALPARFASAFTLLREFHEKGARLSPAALLAELYANTHLLPVFALHPHGGQRVANLLKLIETAQSLTDQGVSTLAALNRFLRFQETMPLDHDVSFLEESESAVRLLTIHQAKGLEFPIVILADAAYGQRRANRTGIVDRMAGQVEIRLGSRDFQYATRGWQKAEAEEQEREAAEERRLWYVAATRVRDHLLIPVPLPAGGAGKNMEHWAMTEEQWSRLTSLYTDAEPLAEIQEKESQVFLYRWQPDTWQSMASTVSPSVALSQIEREESSVQDYLAWEKKRRATLEAGRQAVSITTVQDFTKTSSLFHPPLMELGQAEKQVTKRRFSKLVHAALRQADRRQSAFLAAETSAHPGQAPEDEEEERLVRQTLGSPFLARVREATECRAATSFSLHLSGRLLEGVVDFAFLENGAWVVVDFFVDSILETNIAEYAAVAVAQPRLCAFALERLTRLPVRELVVFFVRSQQMVCFPWDENARSLAESLLTVQTHEKEVSA